MNDLPGPGRAIGFLFLTLFLLVAAAIVAAGRILDVVAA